MRYTIFSFLFLLVGFASVKSSEEDGGRDDNIDINFLLNSLAGHFRPPVKRQFCPPGYFYNPVSGSCMASLSILRQRTGY